EFCELHLSRVLRSLPPGTSSCTRRGSGCSRHPEFLTIASTRSRPQPAKPQRRMPPDTRISCIVGGPMRESHKRTGAKYARFSAVGLSNMLVALGVLDRLLV